MVILKSILIHMNKYVISYVKGSCSCINSSSLGGTLDERHS